MTELKIKHQAVCEAIYRVLELCFHQGVTTTWRDIFLFLRLPEKAWGTDTDLDEPIVIETESDLVLMKAMLSSYFAVKH